MKLENIKNKQMIHKQANQASRIVEEHHEEGDNMNNYTRWQQQCMLIKFASWLPH